MRLYCVGWTGVHLSDAAIDVLTRTGIRMIKDHRRKQKVYNDDISGIVETKFETGMFGTLHGFVFEADIMTDKGESNVVFILNEDVTEERLDKSVIKRTKVKHE